MLKILVKEIKINNTENGKMNIRINNTHIVILMAAGVFLFLSLTGTINSGFHFVDDHEVIKIKHDLNEASLTRVAQKWIMEDINNTGRFRPLYFFQRVIETGVFGTNFFLWSVYNGILCWLSFFMSFLAMRRLSYSIVESFLFILIAFIGPQMEIWWRLGPQESLGVALLSVAFYFLTGCLTGEKSKINNILFIVFIVLTSLTKESFLLVVPPLILFKLWFESRNLWKSLKLTLKNNLLLLIPLGIVLAEVLFIYFRVGTANSGIHDNSGAIIQNIFTSVLLLVKTYTKLIVTVIILIISVLITGRNPFRFDPAYLVLFLLILAPNLLLYSRSGLIDRYLLPTTFAMALFIVAYLKEKGAFAPLYKWLIYTLIFASFIPFLLKNVRDASSFAAEGNETRHLLRIISEQCTPEDLVLIIVDPVESYEKSVSLKTYMFYEFGIDPYAYGLVDPEKNEETFDYVSGWKSYFSGRLYQNSNNKPQALVFLDKHLADRFFSVETDFKNRYDTVSIPGNLYAMYKLRSN